MNSPYTPHLASVALGALEAAASQAAVGRGATATDDLQLFFGPVGPVEQLLYELLQTHLGVGFTRCRLLEELIDLSDLPGDMERMTILYILVLLYVLLKFLYEVQVKPPFFFTSPAPAPM